MFGLNKKFKLASKKPTKTNEKVKINGKQGAFSSVSNKKKSSITAIPDLICKSFVEGCLVLACIHDIKNNELVVSLPGLGNFGYIKLNNISKIYSDLLKNIQLGTSLSTHNKKNSSNHNENSTIGTLLEMYNKGDLLRCKVLSYTDKKLYLTIEPDQVNGSLSFKNLEEEMIISGAVKNKEDHGYTIDLGIDDLTGFFKTSETMSLGQCGLFKILNSPTKRSINLKRCQANENTFYDLKTKYQFDSYLPGARLTNCTIDKITRNGLQVNISNQLFAYVHLNHLPIAKRSNLSTEQKDSFDTKNANLKLPAYTNGDKLTGTIMFINPYSKIIYLSLLPHLNDSMKSAKISKLFLTGESDSLKLGQIIDDAQISAHTFKGIYVKFKGPNDKYISGFVPKRHLFESDYAAKNDAEDDEEENEEEDEKDENKIRKRAKDAKNFNKEDIERLFPLNSKLRVRIYDFSLIEDIILLSCRESVLNALFMNYDELKIGQIVKCTVKSINAKNGGVSVKLSDFVTGFIPKTHTGDVPLSESMLPRKLKPGTELKCKIIQLNPDEKRCVLTAKQTLIKSKLPLIESFDQVRIGMETYGVIVSIQSYGMLVGFLNDMKGLLPRQEISSSMQKDDGQDLKKLYYLGQLVKCSVIDCDKKKETIKLSLIRDAKSSGKKKEKEINDNDESINNEKIEAEYEIGDLIESANILQVNEENGMLRLKLPRGSKHGILYKSHLSDLEFLNDILFEYYKRTLKIPNLMVIQTCDQESSSNAENKKSNKSHCLTAKSSLIEFYTNSSHLAKNFDDLRVNTWHHGWIKKILQNGLLVELPYSLDGFCANQEIKYLKELKSTNINGLNVGQSVLVRINKLFDDKQRFITNIRTRHDLMQKNSQDTDYMIQMLKSFIINTKEIFDFYSNAPNKAEKLTIVETLISKVKLGSIVKVAVKSFNKASGKIECMLIDDIEANNFNMSSTILGHAYIDISSDQENLINMKTYKIGAKFSAMVLGFDPLARVFCLTLDKKKIKSYAKNFDKNFRSQLTCKEDQTVKAEILYVSQWFCIVGLKAHALGRLAIMPLFRNDFTQLNTFRALNGELDEAASNLANKLDAIDSKIKKEQVLAISSASFLSLLPNSIDGNQKEKSTTNGDKNKKPSKDDKQFSYFGIGKIFKVILKSNELDYAIVFNDTSSVKRNKKFLLRQLAILNENHTDSTIATNLNGGLKRKLSELDVTGETILIKKKVVLNETDKNKSKKKRKSAENGGEDLDMIEIVSDIKKVDTKKIKTETTIQNGFNASTSGIGSEFTWEVKDFDQFDEILNKTSAIKLNGDSGTNLAKKETLVKKSKKNEKSGTVEEDLIIHQNEERLFDHDREPETTDDYERLIASRPNSSLWWIKYMVFYLQMAEIDKARNVAQQALKQILYKEDAERLNVWVALLNLENMYGTQATIDDVFNKANQNCDSLKVHCHMAEIYARSSKLQEAEGIFMKMTRKFSKLPEIWVKYGVFHYRNSNCELARKLLIKSFNSLDKRDHVEMVNKFAQLEFKYGDIERAKTMYDSLLFTYPNRTDIWSVYIDMLVKHNKFDDARHIFNRIIQLGLTVKRMKFIFKKYIDFERAHGTDDSVDRVKELATEYVEKNGLNENKKENEKINGSCTIEDNLKKNLKI